MKEDRDEHYWSRFAASYDRDGEYVVGTGILQAIEKRLRKERSLGRTIELGCGTGYFTKAIAGNATQLVATDLSDAMLEVARIELGRFGNVAIQKADCRDIRFPAESFDTAILVNLVHVIENPLQCLQETAWGMSLPQKMNLVFRYLKKWGRPPRHGQSALSPEELVRLVEDSGFEVKAVELLEAGANALYLRGRKG
jgi:ABC-2 type transport system ATP-binding protein